MVAKEGLLVLISSQDPADRDSASSTGLGHFFNEFDGHTATRHKAPCNLSTKVNQRFAGEDFVHLVLEPATILSDFSGQPIDFNDPDLVGA